MDSSKRKGDVILRISAHESPDSEVRLKTYKGLKFLGIWKLILHWKSMDRVYRPIDHGKAWLTVNQSPWPAGEAHWSSVYGCSGRRNSARRKRMARGLHLVPYPSSRSSGKAGWQRRGMAVHGAWWQLNGSEEEVSWWPKWMRGGAAKEWALLYSPGMVR
jgi:hypothetical protein